MKRISRQQESEPVFGTQISRRFGRSLGSAARRMVVLCGLLTLTNTAVIAAPQTFTDENAAAAAVGFFTTFDFETSSGFPPAPANIGLFRNINFDATTATGFLNTPSGVQAMSASQGCCFGSAVIDFSGLLNKPVGIGFSALDLTQGEVVEVTVEFTSGNVGVFDAQLNGAPAFTASFLAVVDNNDTIERVTFRGTESANRSANRAWGIDDFAIGFDEFPPGWVTNPNGSDAEFAWNTDFGRNDNFSVQITSDLGLTSYETTLALSDPIVDGIDEVVYHWSTFEVEGQINQNDLVDWEMTLLANGSPVYTDTIIQGGVIQPIGGVTRTAADIFWDFDLDDGVLFQFRNVLTGTLTNQSGSGIQYSVFDNLTLPADDDVLVTRIENGDPGGINFGDLLFQDSSTDIKPIPGWRTTDFIPVEQGLTYEASVYTFTNDFEGFGNIPAIQYFDANGAFLGTQGATGPSHQTDPVGVWVQKIFQFQPIPSAVKVKIIVSQDVQDLTDVATVNFDDVSLAEVQGSGLGPNLTPNPTFSPMAEVTLPTPAGSEIVLVNRAENPSSLFTATAETVLQEGTTSFDFCVAPDPRENEGVNGTYNPRILSLSELSNTGTCGDLPDVELAAWLRGFPSQSGEVTLAIAVTTTTALFEGVIYQEEFPEVFTGFQPPCDAELSQRPFTVSAPLTSSPFNEPPAAEGKLMTQTTAQCNRPRSLSRRYSAHVFYVRLDEALRSSTQYILDQIAGLSGTLQQASCIDSRFRRQLQRQVSRAASNIGRGNPDAAKANMEEVSRLTQNNSGKFSSCPADANYLGFIKARGLIAAGTIHNRLLFPDPANRQIYQFPADIIIPPLP